MSRPGHQRHRHKASDLFAFGGFEHADLPFVTARHDLIRGRVIGDGEDGSLVSFEGSDAFFVARIENPRRCGIDTVPYHREEQSHGNLGGAR